MTNHLTCRVDLRVFMCLVKSGVNILSVNFFCPRKEKTVYIYYLYMHVALRKNKEIEKFFQ